MRNADGPGSPQVHEQDDNYPPEGRDQEQNHTSPKIYRWNLKNKTQKNMKTSLVLLVFREKVSRKVEVRYCWAPSGMMTVSTRNDPKVEKPGNNFRDGTHPALPSKPPRTRHPMIPHSQPQYLPNENHFACSFKNTEPVFTQRLTRRCLSALFAIIPNRKQPQSPSTKDW